MSCDGAQTLNPFCQAAEVLTNQSTGAVDGAFSHISGYFGMAAMNATTWLWDQIDDATTLDLTSPALAKEMIATASIACVLCLGLFLIQVIASVLRREPGGLGRAVRGPPTQVAEWAGHSVNVLLRVYAKCVYGQDEVARQRIEAAMVLTESAEESNVAQTSPRIPREQP